jgi:hypothetical protein
MEASINKCSRGLNVHQISVLRFLNSISLSIHPSIHLSIYVSVCLSVCLTIYLSLYLSVYLSIYLSIYGFTAVVHLRRFSVSNLYTVGRTPWTGDKPITRTLPAHRTTKTQNKRTQTSMPQVEFEHTTPVFERTKMVHALDTAATVIGDF